MPRKKRTGIISGITTDPENKLTVQKANPLLSLWHSNLTLPEFKILDLYLARINSHEPDERTVHFEKSEIEKIFGVSRIHEQRIKERLINLMGNPVKFYDEDKPKEEQIIMLFSRAVVTHDEYGVEKIALTCTTEAMEYVFNLDNIGYLQYKLRNVARLTSLYSYLLFLYLEKHRKKHIGLIWIEDISKLKQELRCDNEPLYSEYKYFNQRILKRCYQELSEKTECRFSYEAIKKGRVVVAIRFMLEPKRQMLSELEGEPLPGQITIDDIYARADAEFAALNDKDSRTELLREMFMECHGEFNRQEIDVFLIVLERVGAPIHDTYNLLLLLAEKYELMCRANPTNRFAYLKASLERIYDKAAVRI